LERKRRLNIAGAGKGISASKERSRYCMQQKEIRSRVLEVRSTKSAQKDSQRRRVEGIIIDDIEKGSRAEQRRERCRGGKS